MDPGTTDYTPAPKRLRTAMACTSCRSRKTKCNGARPLCDVCQAMGLECHYVTSARGGDTSSRPEAHLSQVERRLEVLEDLLRAVVASGPLEQRSKDNTSADRLSQPFADDWIQDSRSDDRLDGDHEYSGIDIDRVESSVAAQIESPPVDHEVTVDGMGVVTFEDETSSGVFGPTSHSALIKVIASALLYDRESGMSQPSTATYNPSVSRPISPRPRAKIGGGLPTDPAVEGDNVQAMILPAEPTLTSMVNGFFDRIGTMFPYIDRTTTLEELARLKAAKYKGARRSWLCLLDTILAMSSYTSPTFTDLEGERRNRADIFLHRALRLLPNLAFQSANLEILQSLLVLSQYMQGTDHSSYAWTFQRLSIQTAIQIGAHSTSMPAASPIEQEMRNRCWHMCYILDKTCSMTFGRPASLIASQAQISLPLEPSGAKELPISVVAYTQSILIYRILGDVIDMVYHNNYHSGQATATSTLLSNVLSLEHRLADWREGLGPNLHLVQVIEMTGSTFMTDENSSLSLVLTLRYLNTRTLLHRAVLERFIAQPIDHFTLQQETHHIFGWGSVRTCYRSASDMIDLISAVVVQDIPSLTTVWFMVYYVFNSALIIFAVVLIKVRQPIESVELSEVSDENVMNKLHAANQVLDTLGLQTRMAVRCRKYLGKFIDVASSIISPRTNNDFPLLMNGYSDFTTNANLNFDLADLLFADDDISRHLSNSYAIPIM